MKSTRKERILKACEEIQKQLDFLKTEKCTLDLAYHSFCIFDNTINPKNIPMTPDGDNRDFSPQVVFTFK